MTTDLRRVVVAAGLGAAAFTGGPMASSPPRPECGAAAAQEAARAVEGDTRQSAEREPTTADQKSEFRLVAVELSNRDGQGQVVLRFAGTIPAAGVSLPSSAPSLEAALGGARWTPVDQIAAQVAPTTGTPATPWTEPFRIDVDPASVARLERLLPGLVDRRVRLLTLQPKQPEIEGRLLEFKDRALRMEGSAAAIPLDSVVAILPDSSSPGPRLTIELRPAGGKPIPYAEATLALPAKTWKPLYRWRLGAPRDGVAMFALVANDSPYAWNGCNVTLVDGGERYVVLTGSLASRETGLLPIRPQDQQAAEELARSSVGSHWMVTAAPAVKPPVPQTPRRFATWEHAEALDRFWKPGIAQVFDGDSLCVETSVLEVLPPFSDMSRSDRRKTRRIALPDTTSAQIVRVDSDGAPNFPTEKDRVLRVERPRTAEFTFRPDGPNPPETMIILPPEEGDNGLPSRLRLTSQQPVARTYPTIAQLPLDRLHPSILAALARAPLPSSATPQQRALFDLLRNGDALQRDIARLAAERGTAIGALRTLESDLARALAAAASTERQQTVTELTREVHATQARISELELNESRQRSQYDALIRNFR